MSSCKQCGGSVDANAQCPQCGAFHIGGDDEGILDLAEAVEEPTAGVSEQPSAAQLGALADVPAFAAVEESAPAPELAPAVPQVKPQAPSYAEQQHGRRLTFWWATRIPVLLILGWFTASHLVFGARWVFIDNVNILIHEAGHVLFGWGWTSLVALGGTLAQLLMPAIFAVYFGFWRRERFAAVAAVWWIGENLMPIAIYMNDAVVQELPLLGGGQHDWTYLFGKWKVLSSANEIAAFFHWVGVLTMLGALVVLTYWTVRPTKWELESGMSARD